MAPLLLSLERPSPFPRAPRTRRAKPIACPFDSRKRGTAIVTARRDGARSLRRRMRSACRIANSSRTSPGSDQNNTPSCRSSDLHPTQRFNYAHVQPSDSIKFGSAAGCRHEDDTPLNPETHAGLPETARAIVGPSSLLVTSSLPEPLTAI
eukprot:1385878-Pleurochrysis_carterae.AAC.2